MENLKSFKFIKNDFSENIARSWFDFLQKNNFTFEKIKEIDFTTSPPCIYDHQGNRFCIDFGSDKKNYHKKKSSLKKEMIARALGSGRYGLQVLDLSVGLGIDAVFLSQLGFEVIGVERNPLIYLALQEALTKNSDHLKVKFIFESALKYLEAKDKKPEIIYFDPMFPDKKKSALPKQEMVFFKNLVGNDDDAEGIVKYILDEKMTQRLVVKRPVKAPALCRKPQSQIVGKLIRFDIYNRGL